MQRRMLILLPLFWVSCTGREPEKELSFEDITYEIRNKTLISLVERFDRSYSYILRGDDRAIDICCYYKTADSAKYVISYASGLSMGTPRFLCRPVNGTPVAYSVSSAGRDLCLSPLGDAAFLQHFLPKEYADYMEKVRREGVTSSSELQLIVERIHHRVAWYVVLDKNQNLLRFEEQGQSGVTKIPGLDVRAGTWKRGMMPSALLRLLNPGQKYSQD